MNYGSTGQDRCGTNGRGGFHRLKVDPSVSRAQPKIGFLGGRSHRRSLAHGRVSAPLGSVLVDGSES
jgi:hypothetical protein